MNEQLLNSNFDGIYNVLDFGAIGDGEFDNTEAFTKAFDEAGKKGGIVYAPPGNYIFDGRLNIPVAVTLQGSFTCAHSHNGCKHPGFPKPSEYGTVLMPKCDKDTEDAPAFITLNTNSVLSGVTIYYPEQIKNEKPHKYPWTIAMRGKNPAVLDTELLNPYNAIDASENERHTISRVTGQPLRRGIFIDQIYDIGRITDVHFNPWWSAQPEILKFMIENGEAFIIGRCDWEYMSNCFSIFYKVGFIFDDFGSEPGNVELTQCGHDEAPITVIVNQCQPHAGISFNNCQMMGEIFVKETNVGPVKFNNCGFWGDYERPYHDGSGSLMHLKGSGHISINACSFYGWDKNPKTKGSPAIEVDCTTSTISSCNFIGENKEHIHILENAKKCIILGNKFNGGIKIKKANEDAVEEGFNVNV